jgi:hypothetical protein
MDRIKKFTEKLAYDLSQVALSNVHKRDSFNGEILYVSAIEKLIDNPAEIIYLAKNGFIIHLVNYVEDKYTVTIYFKPSQLDEVKFYINSLNKKL